MLGAAIAAIAAGGVIMSRLGVLGFPLLRDHAINLVASRGAPRLWLVAHLDSKSQPVPMLLRIAGLAASSAALVVLVILALRGAMGMRDSADLWRAVMIAGAVATLPVMLSVVGSRSPGAIDDASGVATVLVAAARLPRDLSIGVVLTSAEELGMAGARAFAAIHAPAIALNVDGVDDRGALRCMRHGGRSRARAGVERAARAMGIRLRVSGTIPGLLTDGVALAEAGWSAVTLSRGTLATLARVHRPADDLDHLQGKGVDVMARLLAAAAREIA